MYTLFKVTIGRSMKQFSSEWSQSKRLIYKGQRI